MWITVHLNGGLRLKFEGLHLYNNISKIHEKKNWTKMRFKCFNNKEVIKTT